MKTKQLPPLAVGEFRACRILQTYNETRDILRSDFSSSVLSFEITRQDIAWSGDILPDDSLVLRLMADIQLPAGAIIEWTRGTIAGDQRRWWFIKNIISRAQIRPGDYGVAYHCLPCRIFQREEGRNV